MSSSSSGSNSEDIADSSVVAVSVQFFGDRINDESGLKEAAQGLKALQKARRFSGDDAIQTVKALVRPRGPLDDMIYD